MARDEVVVKSAAGVGSLVFSLIFFGLSIVPLAFGIWVTSLGNSILDDDVADWDDCELWQLAIAVRAYGFVCFAIFSVLALMSLFQLLASCLHLITSASNLVVCAVPGTCCNGIGLLILVLLLPSLIALLVFYIISWLTLFASSPSFFHCHSQVNVKAWGGCQAAAVAAPYWGSISGFLYTSYALAGASPIIGILLFCLFACVLALAGVGCAVSLFGGFTRRPSRPDS